MDDREFPDDVLDGSVEPGTPSLENALFVLLGALSTLAVVFRMIGLV